MFPSEPRRRPWSGVQQFLGLGGNNSSEPVGSSCKDWGQDEPDPDRCFSIVFTNHTAIHLEVPHDGNGRSRNEWLSAFEDLRTNQLDLDFVLPRKSKR